MELYSREYTIRSRDVNLFARLRTSQLFELMQEAATDHSERLGVGIPEIRRQNLMWVLARQSVEIARLPCYGEKIVLETWPGRTVHSLYPRYYRILDAAGEPLLSSAAIWMLVDRRERVLVPSSRSGIEFGFDKRGCEIALPSPPRRFFTDQSRSFTVPFSYADMNGHMNNTRYFDLADDLCPAAAEGREAKGLVVEFAAELLPGQSCELYYGMDRGRFYLKAGDDRPLFRLVIDYEE